MIKLLKQIMEDRKKGLSLSVNQAAIAQGQWLKLFGTHGCYYTDVRFSDMVDGLLDHYNLK